MSGESNGGRGAFAQVVREGRLKDRQREGSSGDRLGQAVPAEGTGRGLER